MEIRKLPLKANQYHKGIYDKKVIILHHTAGGSALSSIAWWAKDPRPVATPYIIDRDGIIYECFDPKYWAYHIGAGVLSLEQQSIGIELANYGSLTLKDGKYTTYVGSRISKEKVIELPAPFRGSKYWEAYTPKQIAALKELLQYLVKKFKIEKQPDTKNFYEYRNPKTIKAGIYSHTSARRDKKDIFPQPDLLKIVAEI
jgi:N-acetyl-anhydromuramyl-L-alanine amidase AmpD